MISLGAPARTEPPWGIDVHASTNPRGRTNSTFLLSQCRINLWAKVENRKSVLQGYLAHKKPTLP